MIKRKAYCKHPIVEGIKNVVKNTSIYPIIEKAIK